MANLKNNAPRRVTSLLTQNSRYSATNVFLDNNTDDVFFGTWRVPEILQTRPSSYHVVLAHQAFRPDLVSFAIYSDPNLFWAIAILNNISIPLTELTAGLILEYPNIEDVIAATNGGRSSSTQYAQ